MFNLQVSPQEFQLIWTCLMEQAGKNVFGLGEKLKAQVSAQESEQQEQAIQEEIAKRKPPAEVPASP